jgi:hypothetical protein
MREAASCGGQLRVACQPEAFLDRVTVAVGAFTDPRFPVPRHSVYESRRHRWLAIETGAELEQLG